VESNVFTIVLARRFATYKRLDLILGILDNLIKKAKARGLKLQVIFAGKANPYDKKGQEIIAKRKKKAGCFNHEHA